MTTAELIAELQKYPPHKTVRVNIDSFEAEDEAGSHWIPGPSAAIDIDCVVYEGSHVTIEAQ